MTTFGAGGAGGAVEVRRLAEKYGMDVERFERLVRSVNVPSVREGGGGDAVAAGSVRYVRDSESGEDVLVKEVSPSFPFSSTFSFSFFKKKLFLYRSSGGSQSLVRSSWVFFFFI